jgi:hypothetical protein
MSEKNVIDISDFDFGFTTVDESELGSIQAKDKEIQQSEKLAASYSAEADEFKAKMNALYKAVTPLLDNLAQNPSKEYIYWPNRTAKLDQFKLKLMQIIND